ncbi:MAG: FHA domain-containing protein [Anaerolineaceae bacterium]|nr:FHA domain-containing protein [Anaerolineaceae bacterium]
MVDSLICPVCHRRNRADVTQCAYCGEALIRPAILIKPEKPADYTEQAYIEQLLHQHEDGLVLYIAGYKQCIVFKHAEQVILGRQIKQENAPVIDLVDYGGHTLGVSRQHAQITLSGNAYFLTDLNSANGTFVNEKPLEPDSPYQLYSGDMIRLGQLLIFAYFFSGQSQKRIDEQHFTLIMNPLLSQYPASPGLTAARLNNHLMPYLNALIDLQHFADMLHHREPEEVSILSIIYSQEDGVISIGLRGGGDAVFILRQLVREWRRRKANDLLQQRRLNQAPGVLSSETARIDADRTLDTEDISAQVHDIIHQFQDQLLVDVLAHILPEHDPSDMKTYLDQMLPFLRILSFSPLEIFATQPHD